jgi:[NiFe] hydrogenase diaphorase moiety small subunit
MVDRFTFTIDGVEVQCKPGQSILSAALEADVYIPHLCFHPGLKPHGSCRVCTVKSNGRFVASCTTPAEEGTVVLNETDPELKDYRKAVIEMLFVEGNHYCMFCEKSGNCELQAIAYKLGMLAPRFPYVFPRREVDSTHSGIFMDRSRCMQCGRCVQASRDLDKKHAFELIGRGLGTKLGVDSESGLAGTEIKVTDRAAMVCPVGAMTIKGTAFAKPVGKRLYDKEPIGSEIDEGRLAKQAAGEE